MFFIVACGNESTAPGSASEQSDSFRLEPVVVYATHDDEAYLPSLFADFTRETGIRVTVRHADAKTSVDDVINDRGSPPADVLLSPDVLSIWKAAEEGALRPLTSESLIRTIDAQVPAHLRDPDGTWVAVSARAAAIAYDSHVVDASVLAGYESLADESQYGSVCLSSSSLAVNRSLIAMLIDELGVRPAEILVRGWVRNLALPTFESDADLLAAIDAGTCALGIVALPEKYAGVNAGDNKSIRFFVPQPAFTDIEGFGVARHAREPESAQRLIEWFLSSHAGDFMGDKLSTRNVAVAAWRAEDAIKLAERAGYR
ncbi:MAG: extracellular solute-binding protein [Gammaproteobacteria bacterium]|nr:extracellular solute-binding protein [Gammaproteobacteria bacterium]